MCTGANYAAVRPMGMTRLWSQIDVVVVVVVVFVVDVVVVSSRDPTQPSKRVSAAKISRVNDFQTCVFFCCFEYFFTPVKIKSSDQPTSSLPSSSLKVFVLRPHQTRKTLGWRNTCDNVASIFFLTSLHKR